MFTYHFPFVAEEYANQRVITSGGTCWVAGGRADREVKKRKGIKGSSKQSMYRRSCYPIDEGKEDAEF